MQPIFGSGYGVGGQCFERDSRCYGYFGVTPSLVRLPVIGILRYVRSALTPVFLTLAVLLACRTTQEWTNALFGVQGGKRQAGFAKIGSDAGRVVVPVWVEDDLEAVHIEVRAVFENGPVVGAVGVTIA